MEGLYTRMNCKLQIKARKQQLIEFGDTFRLLIKMGKTNKQLTLKYMWLYRKNKSGSKLFFLKVKSMMKIKYAWTTYK